MKTSKYSSRTVPKCAQQIQYGEQRPSWKKWEIVICQQPFDRFWRYVIWRVFMKGFAFWSYRWYCFQYWGLKNATTLQFSLTSVWAFSSPTCKILKLVIETTEAIPRKLWKVIKTSKYFLWVVPKCAPATRWQTAAIFTDNEQLLYLSNRVTDFDAKYVEKKVPHKDVSFWVSLTLFPI